MDTAVAMDIAVIDDHPLMVAAVSAVIARLDGHYRAAGHLSLEEYDEAVAGGARYHLVLLDLGLPGYEGLAALEYFRQWHDDTPVVVFSATHDRVTVLSALGLGAMGFIPKTSSDQVLRNAIMLVLVGQPYIPSDAINGAVAGDRHENLPRDAIRPIAPMLHEAPALAGLTPRQREVLGLLIKALPNKLICRELGLSPNTVKKHLGAVFGALGARNRTEAVIKFQALARVDMQRGAPRN